MAEGMQKIVSNRLSKVLNILIDLRNVYQIRYSRLYSVKDKIRTFLMGMTGPVSCVAILSSSSYTHKTVCQKTKKQTKQHNWIRLKSMQSSAVKGFKSHQGCAEIPEKVSSFDCKH